MGNIFSTHATLPLPLSPLLSLDDKHLSRTGDRQGIVKGFTPIRMNYDEARCCIHFYNDADVKVYLCA